MKYQDEYLSFRVDRNDFMRGSNSYNDIPDGGFLASTIGMNPFGKPGLLTQAPSLGNSVTPSLPQRGVVSWALGYGSGAPVIFATMLFGSEQPKWCTVNASTGAFTQLSGSDSTGGRTYTMGLTDTIFYNSKMYTSVMGDIVEQNVDGSSRDLTWWTSTKGQASMTTTAPHPMLVYESIMYVADGRYLHKNDNGTCSSQVFDLPPNYVITAMVEYDSLIHITAEPYPNNDGTIHGATRMYTWDGTSDSWFSEYYLDYRINAMYVYKNRLFMWNNHYVGQWDGAKLVPLKTVSAQVFKCHITETSDSMLYADGTTIVRFGSPIIPGNAERFYNYLTSPLGYVWTGIISVQNNNLIAVENGLSISESKNYYISNINTPTSSGFRILNFNPRFFKVPVKVVRVVVEMEPLTSATIYPFYINDKGQEIQGSYKSGIITSSDSDMAGRTYFDLEYGSKNNTRSVQPRLYLFNAPYIRSIDFYYKPVEKGLGVDS